MSEEKKKPIKELTAYLCFPFWVEGYEYDSEKFNAIIGLLNVSVFLNSEDTGIPYFKLIPVVNKIYTESSPPRYIFSRGQKKKTRNIIKECDVVFITYEEHTTSSMLFELHTARTLNIQLVRLPTDLLDDLS